MIGIGRGMLLLGVVLYCMDIDSMVYGINASPTREYNIVVYSRCT